MTAQRKRMEAIDRLRAKAKWYRAKAMWKRANEIEAELRALMNMQLRAENRGKA